MRVGIAGACRYASARASGVGPGRWGSLGPPFVTVGGEVREGQTLLIIEAMKVMNPIRAPQSGRVADVLVSNGDPVEYGELLLTIE